MQLDRTMGQRGSVVIYRPTLRGSPLQDVGYVWENLAFRSVSNVHLQNIPCRNLLGFLKIDVTPGGGYIPSETEET